jgi:hypothetical protein
MYKQSVSSLLQAIQFTSSKNSAGQYPFSNLHIDWLHTLLPAAVLFNVHVGFLQETLRLQP